MWTPNTFWTALGALAAVAGAVATWAAIDHDVEPPTSTLVHETLVMTPAATIVREPPSADSRREQPAPSSPAQPAPTAASEATYAQDTAPAVTRWPPTPIDERPAPPHRARPLEFPAEPVE